jgi:signal transduction histidine kinase
MTIVDDSYHRLVYTQYEGPMDITPVFYPGKEISGEYIVNGDRKLYIALPIEGDTDVAQAVVMYCSLKDIYDEVYSICRDLIGMSVILVVVFAFFSVVIFSRITHPIRKVNAAITSMIEGNLNQHVDAKGNDEIASLCNSFNDMNSKIIAVDEQRRQFVADASHELKSPLASIKVLVQSLLAGGIDNRDISVEFLQDVEQEVDRLSDIVGSL